MRIVFMGTPDFAVPALQTLIDSPHDVIAVYSQPPRPAGRGQKERPSPVHHVAEKHGIPVYTPVSLKGEEEQAVFTNLNADIAVVTAYGLLLPKAILEAYPYGCVNIHPSLLPRWRGAAPIQRAIMAGDTETGIAIMQMDEGLDTGDILLEETVAIPANATAGELHDQLAEQGAALLLSTIDRLENNAVTPQTQSDDGVTYAKKIHKSDGEIHWQQSANVILNQIRGLSPWPGAFFTVKDQKIKIFSAEVKENSPAFLPAGTVFYDHKTLCIQCGEHAIQPKMVQRPGKKPMLMGDMLKGFPIEAGTTL